MKKINLLLLFVLLSVFSFAQVDVYSPALKSPENNAENQMPNAVLDWNAVSGSLSINYEAQIDTDSLFSNPVIFDTELSSVENQFLTFNQKYFWRVRAIDGDEISAWSETRAFTVFDIITLYKPNDDKVGLDPMVTLKWKGKAGSNSISGISKYDYQLDTCVDFTNPINGFLNYEQVSYPEVDVNNLSFNTKYYWRIRATHDLGSSSWSEVRNFSIIEDFGLVSPSNGAINQGIAVELECDEVDGAKYFDVQLDMNGGNFVDPYKLLSEVNVLTVENLSFGKEYFWRVRARHDADTSIWTSVWNFNTINTVLLNEPENDALDIDVLPILEWDKISGTVSYQLQYDTIADFNNPFDIIIPNSEDDAITYQLDNSLKHKQNYFWRVRAINTVDTTMWSDVWTFKTKSATGIEDIAVLKSSLNIFPNPATFDLTLKFNTKKSININISVLDLIGKVIYAEEFNSKSGQNIKNININDFDNGTYLIKIQNGNDVITKRFVVAN